ncbi:MAG: hypothetical protein AAF456_07840 [Planctomycetota bacterium]
MQHFVLRAEIWIATTVISVLIIGGMSFYWPRTDESAQSQTPQRVPATERENVEAPEESSPQRPQPAMPVEIQNQNGVNPISPVEKGDDFLLVGNFVEAIKHYQKALDYAEPGSSPARLLVKLGFCSEQAGFLEQSSSYYHRAIQESQSEQVDRLFAISGLSRVWQGQGRLDEALDLLSELFLRSGTNDAIPEEFRQQVVYQLASTIQRIYLMENDYAYGDPLRLEFNWCEPLIEEMLNYGTVPAPSTDTEEDTLNPETREPLTGQLAVRVLQRPGDDANLIAVDLVSEGQPAKSVLEEIGNKTELDIELTGAAGAEIAGRSFAIDARGMSVALVLDNCLASLNLIWQQDGKTVLISHRSEFPDKAEQLMLNYADRVLRWVELTFGRQPRRESSLMHRGNLSLISGDYESARLRYNELLETRPNGELSAKLSFNIAKLEIANQRPAFAVDRFMHSVDQTLDFGIQSAGYTWIGRLELASGNTRNAIYAASRAMAVTDSRQVIQENTMTLARAYLLDNDPYSANRALFDNVDALSDDRTRRIAGIFGSYARFITTASSPDHGYERERLLLSLSAVASDEIEGFVDEMLIGRAFFEVGLTQQSGELFERALSRSDSDTWRERIAFELGMQRYRSGNEDEAAGIFSEIAAVSQDRQGVLAKMMLARIFLQRKEAEACLQICRDLWAGPLEDQDKGITLEIMGKAYQLLDQHHSAAVCFSGMVPEYATPSDNESVDDDTDAPAPPSGVPFNALQPVPETELQEVNE